MEKVTRTALAAPLAAMLAALLMGGCSGGDSVPSHTAAEDKAMQDIKNLTPEQRIEQIKNAPMPEGAKAAMIDKIKKENGIQ